MMPAKLGRCDEKMVTKYKKRGFFSYCMIDVIAVLSDA